MPSPGSRCEDLPTALSEEGHDEEDGMKFQTSLSDMHEFFAALHRLKTDSSTSEQTASLFVHCVIHSSKHVQQYQRDIITC